MASSRIKTNARALLIGLAVAFTSPAQAAPPVVHIYEGAHETPAAAAAAVSATTTSMWTLNTAHPEVIALARSLNSDPTKTADRIYEYVRNTVETLPMHGLKKGSMGAIIDKKGTALDQAVLMADLLHAAGKTNAKVHLVELQLSFAEFDAWHGAGNAGDICRLLKAGGIPFDFVGTSFTGDCSATTGATAVKLMHAVVGYGNKYYDPSYKTQTHIAGIDLGAAMGFSLANLQGAANFTKGTTNGVPYVSGAGVQAAVEGEMQARAAALVAELRQEDATSIDPTSGDKYLLSTTDVVGGVEIAAATDVEGSNYGANSIVGLDGDHMDLGLSYGRITDEFRLAIPDDLRTQITISHNGGSFSARLDELYGFRLWFSELGTDITFNVGGNRRWTYPYSSVQPIEIIIDQPYGVSRTESFNPPFSVGDSAALVFSSGHTGLGLQGRIGDKIYQESYLVPTGLAVADPDSQAIAQMSLGGAFLAQQSQLTKVLEGVTDSTVLVHDFVGIIAGNNATDINPHTDIRGEVSVLVLGGVAHKIKAVNTTLTSALNVLEASVADQVADVEAGAAKSHSAVSLLTGALSGGDAIYGVAEDNFASVEPQLQSYSASVLDRLYDDTPATPTGYNTSHDIVLPQSGNAAVVGTTTITPYVTIDPITGAQGFLVDDSVFSTMTSMKGTYSSDVSSEQALELSREAMIATVGLDPGVIPSVSGAGFAGTDLVSGSGAFPYALPFRRSFSGGASIARGWSHNFDIDARYGAGSMIGLGARRPVEAASAIAALFATYKYLEHCLGAVTCSTAEQVALSAVTANWLQNALVDNVLYVRTGHSFTTFAKLATGEYFGPDGDATTVTTSVSRIFIEALDGQKTTFLWDAPGARYYKIEQMTWPSGMRVDFAHSYTLNSNGLTWTMTVSNNIGRSLTIIRQAPKPDRRFLDFIVTDENGVGSGITEYDFTSANPYSRVAVNGVTVANYYFDTSGRITRIDTPGQTNKVLYSYNALGQMERSDIADLNIYSAFYRNDWRVETASRNKTNDILVSSQSVVSDPYGRQTISVDALGNQARTEFDRLGRVTRSLSPVDEAGQYGYATIAYDKYHNRLKATTYSKETALGVREQLTTSFAYHGPDKYRQLHTVTDPLNRVTTLDYFANTETLASGRRGQLKSQTLPAVAVAGGGSAAPVTSFAYGANGLIDEITAPDSTKTTFAYTGGLPTTVTADAGTGGLALATNFTYYLNGDLKTVQDHRTGGAITTFVYDPLRRQEKVSAPGTAYSEVEYDGDGRVTKSKLCVEGSATCDGINILQQVTRTYDGAGRVLTVTDNASNTSSVVYDDISRTITVTDPRGVKQQRLFDVLGRTVQTTHNYQPAAGTSTIIEKVAFLQDGTLDYVEDGRATKTYYNYDHFNRVTKTNYVGGSSEEITGYDAIGRPTALKTRAGDTVALTYNDLDWVTQRKITRLVGGAVVTYDFTYDIMGRVKTVTHADSSTTNPAQTVTYSYDSLGRPTDEVGANGLQAGYSYDDALGKTTLYYGDRTNAGTYNVTYSTDALGRLSGIADTSSIAAYSYDAQSRVDQITFGNGTSQSLSYEVDSGWLNTLSLDAVGTVDDVTFTYTRDDEGRITNEHINNDSYAFKQHKVTPQSISYLANGDNQYTMPADILHVYDGNGNLTDDGDYTYAYDGENRLTEARKRTSPTTTTLVGEYSYDAVGRRSEKKVTAGNVTTRYMYAGNQVLAEYNQSNVMQRRYVYGPGIDNPLMVEEADGTRHYLHRDGKGSIMAASFGSGVDIGEVAFKFTADAWGFGADETTSPYRFTARRVDEETGNYYYRNRYYHPDSGRFMSNDPIGYGDGLNMYAYAYNDPVNFTDPLGLCGTRLSNSIGTSCSGASIIRLSAAAGDANGGDGSDDGGYIASSTWCNPAASGCIVTAPRVLNLPAIDLSLLTGSGPASLVDVIEKNSATPPPEGTETRGIVGEVVTARRFGAPVNSLERAYSLAGDRLRFWRSRLLRGDPVAALAIDTIANVRLGKLANQRLTAFSKVYLGRAVDLNQVGIDIMRAHVDALDLDETGIIGLLSSRQVAIYHHAVFSNFGLPATTFGGTPITGTLAETSLTAFIWCGGCDSE